MANDEYAACRIKRVEVENDFVKIELENGVKLSISSNPNSFYFSFSGTDLPLRWRHMAGGDAVGEAITNNTCSCEYALLCFG